jgi:hypothetical protein
MRKPLVPYQKIAREDQQLGGRGCLGGEMKGTFSKNDDYRVDSRRVFPVCL